MSQVVFLVCKDERGRGKGEGKIWVGARAYMY
jgi:hypothetical protein